MVPVDSLLFGKQACGSSLVTGQTCGRDRSDWFADEPAVVLLTPTWKGSRWS
jgi:hypothetical protein